METKRETQIRHALRRLYDRYEIRINEQQLEELRKLVTTNKAIFVKKQDERVSFWKIPYMDRKLIAAYDKVTKTFRTFLPEHTPDDKIGQIGSKYDFFGKES